MRFGSRVAVICVLLLAGMCSRAWASDTLNVFVDNNHAALGAITTLAAHADTDAAYGGGHIQWKYQRATSACAASPAADTGTDANGSVAASVAAGAGMADVGGQTVEFGVGKWLVCGWLVDDATGTTAAAGSTLVTIVPYIGSVSLRATRTGRAFQITATWATSAPARLYIDIQNARQPCARRPAAIPRDALLLSPRAGRVVGSDGGLGHAVGASQIGYGRWRVCALLRAKVGAAGPATRTFAVRRHLQRAERVAG